MLMPKAALILSLKVVKLTSFFQCQVLVLWLAFESDKGETVDF